MNRNHHRGRASAQAVTKPAIWFHHADPETKNWSTQATMIPTKPAVKYLSQDLVINHFTKRSTVPRIIIGTHGAIIVWIAPIRGPLTAGIRKKAAGPATNKVASSIMGRWTSGRRL